MGEVAWQPAAVDEESPAAETDAPVGVSDEPPRRVVHVLARKADAVAKRALDAVVAAAVLLAFAPLIACIALLIKLDSRGPIFYRCRRAGYRGRELRMLKFRKMRDDAAGPPLALVDDDRFTAIGRFLARAKLDELPQLWNVFKGEMSLVGPRPEDLAFVAVYPNDYERILQVKTGVTGLCQLAFAKEGEILDRSDRLDHYVARLLPQKVRMDLLYAHRRSFVMDLRILIWTAVAVIARRDVAVDRSDGRLTLRRRRSSAIAATRVQATNVE